MSKLQVLYTRNLSEDGKTKDVFSGLRMVTVDDKVILWEYRDPSLFSCISKAIVEQNFFFRDWINPKNRQELGLTNVEYDKLLGYYFSHLKNLRALEKSFKL